MNEVSGVGEISKGNVPSAGIPAIGMQFLQEMDDTRIGTITENNEYGYADVGRFILKFVQKYYEYPRTLQIAGKGMEYAVKQFTGKQLRGNTDVTVVRGSTLPGSKVLRRQEIINLHQSGYLGDPADPQVRENVLQMLEYGDIADVWKDYSLDKAQFEKHIAMIENEQLPEIYEFDNHPLHIKELNRYRKTEKFDALSDKSKGILLEALEIHAGFATEMMNPGIIGNDSPTNPMNEQSMDAQMMEDEVKQGMAEEMPAGEEMAMEEMPEGEF
jgi:hypothetical protein